MDADQTIRVGPGQANKRVVTVPVTAPLSAGAFYCFRHSLQPLCLFCAFLRQRTYAECVSTERRVAKVWREQRRLMCFLCLGVITPSEAVEGRREGEMVGGGGG